MGKNILIVDDDPVILEMVEMGLKRQNYNVRRAKEGKEALAAVREFKPDLIVLDIMMPHMDGTEVARHLKEDPLHRHIPIIFLTVLWEKDDPTLDPSAFGANLVLGKPFKIEELLEKIKHILR